MSIEKSMKKNKKLIVAFAVIVIVFAVYSGVIPLGIVTPGWELYNQIGALKVDNTIKTKTTDFTTPNDITGPYWKVDPDDPNAGIPTIMIQTSDIRHVDFTGSVTPDNQPAAEKKATINGHTYLFDYHVYMFDVTVRTVADRTVTKTGVGNGDRYPVWSHETYWPFTGDAGASYFPAHTSFTTSDPTKEGKQFSGGVFEKFIISPWTGVAPYNGIQNATLVNAWAGVMNTYIFTKEQGQVANQWGDISTPSGDAPLFVKGGLDNGAQVPMLKDDGTYGVAAPTVNWDYTNAPRSDIASTVVLYLPVQESAGAYLTRDWIGGVTALTPCDVYVKYTLRIDVLTTHDYVLQGGNVVPTLAPPTDFYSWVKGFWDGLFSPGNLLITFMVMVLIIIGLVLALRPSLWKTLLRRNRHE